MRKVKLQSDELRRWRENRTLLVDAETGEHYRAMTEEETVRLEVAKKKGTDVRFQDEQGRPLRILADREVLKAELLARHGSCNLTHVNGRFLTRLVGEDHKTMPAPGRDVVIQGAPDPNRCICARWEGRHPMKHHHRCTFNELAPMHQRELVPRETVTVVSSPAIDRVIATKIAVASPHIPPDIPSPTDCICYTDEWLFPDPSERGKMHHPLCEYRDLWKQVDNPTLTESYVCDMKGHPIRPASQAEVAEATETKCSIGIPTIKLDGQEYLVRRMKGPVQCTMSNSHLPS
jgi:hypothetical protein